MDSRGTQWYGYDPAYQLNDAQVGGSTTSYIYHGDGVRAARETSSTYTEYVIDHNRSLPVGTALSRSEPMCYNIGR
jgi:hypothetical protein